MIRKGVKTQDTRFSDLLKTEQTESLKSANISRINKLMHALSFCRVEGQHEQTADILVELMTDLRFKIDKKDVEEIDKLILNLEQQGMLRRLGNKATNMQNITRLNEWGIYKVILKAETLLKGAMYKAGLI